jgi:glyoxylase-like metal-dependent hydrolase (beta-lactamase superfamily II)/rhodanese-related sulfurtransferase
MSDSPTPATDVSGLSPADLHARLQSGEAVSVLDVRDRDEFEAWHVDGPTVESAQIPYVKFVQAEVKGGAADLVEGLAEPIVVVCGHGEASAYVAEMLQEAGVDARNLEEGMDGWARLLAAESFSVPPGGTVVQYQRPSSGCLGYMVVSDGEAVVVDPLRAFTDRYLADARAHDAELKYVVDTHVHADHVSGARDLVVSSDARYLLPKGARKRGATFTDDPDVVLVEDGDEFRVGDLILTAVALPGHTTEMLGYALDDVVFTGDTVFRDSVARPDLEAGDDGAEEHARLLSRTLRNELLPLPDDTRLCPGHFTPGTAATDDGTYTLRIGDVEARVGDLATDEEAFVEFVLSEMPDRPANYETIIATNLGKRETPESEAFELELGPNNCAATSFAD